MLLICFCEVAREKLLRNDWEMVGKSVAEKAIKAGVESITFDRGGYLYHGRVKSLAEGARGAGLKF